MAGCIHCNVNEVIRMEPLQEQQEEEVDDSHEGEDGACDSTTVGAQPPQSSGQRQDRLPACLVIHLQHTHTHTLQHDHRSTLLPFPLVYSSINFTYRAADLFKLDSTFLSDNISSNMLPHDNTYKNSTQAHTPSLYVQQHFSKCRVYGLVGGWLLERVRCLSVAWR